MKILSGGDVKELGTKGDLQMKKTIKTQDSFYEDIKAILQKARDTAYKSVNFIMLEAYWNIS